MIDCDADALALPECGFDALVFAGEEIKAREWDMRLAEREGPLIPLITEDSRTTLMQRLTVEKTISTNTTAAGGNAALLLQSVEGT